MSAGTDQTKETSRHSGMTSEDTAETSMQPPGSPFPVVGIGASAGGLEALSALLRALPARIGMSLMMVLHLDPTHESSLTAILGRATKMPVSEAAHGMRVEPDHVYVIPPNVEMRLTSGGVIALNERAPVSDHVLPVDTLMVSLAEEYANLAIGVVLSGTGSDGVLGLGAIKAAGGLTFAQDHATAEFDGMPKAATESGVVDMTLDIAGIAAELVRLGKHSELGAPREPGARADEDAEWFAQILSLVRNATGLDLSGYRKTTLLRRISRRMLLESLPDMGTYLRLLQQQPSKVEALYRDVLVNATEFFRHPDALDALRSKVLPRILEHKEHDVPIRIWVPGCSKGQEPYSILIILIELLDGVASPPEIQMFASDVNAHDIEFARVGLYPLGIAREVTPERLARFFTQGPDGYQVNREIREMCIFAVHDVTKDPPFSKLDLVSFRNVLIYMEKPLQEQVLHILHYALAPGGFLLLGSSESISSGGALFTVIDKKHRIYEREPGPGTSRRWRRQRRRSLSRAFGTSARGQSRRSTSWRPWRKSFRAIISRPASSSTPISIFFSSEDTLQGISTRRAGRLT